MTDNRLIAKLLKHHGGKLLDQAVDRLAPPAGTPSAGTKAAHPSLPRKLANAALLRIATRSVPGAILVGGGLAAVYLRDRHKARKARSSGNGSSHS